MSGSLSQGAVIVIVIVGTGAAVLIGYSIFYVSTRRGPEEDTSTAGTEFDQVRYMREVRLREVDAIAASHGLGRRW